MADMLEPVEAYRLWAPTYEADGALASLDEMARRRLDPSPRAPLLDAACGTGRRLRAGDGGRIPHGFGVDLVLEMLVTGRPAATAVAAADLRELPFGPASFRTVWCRLALGHLLHLGAAYGEFARVLAPGGRLLVTDFHPEASRRGLQRTFHAGGKTWAVVHHLHETVEHEAEGERAGLLLDAVLDVPVSQEIRAFYEGAGAEERFERERGFPVLLALEFTRA